MKNLSTSWPIVWPQVINKISCNSCTIENSFHHSQTSKWTPQEEKKWNEKRKRTYNVYFDPMTWISSKQQYFIAATLSLTVGKLAYPVDR